MLVVAATSEPGGRHHYGSRYASPVPDEHVVLGRFGEIFLIMWTRFPQRRLWTVLATLSLHYSCRCRVEVGDEGAEMVWKKWTGECVPLTGVSHCSATHSTGKEAATLGEAARRRLKQKPVD